VRPIIRTNSLSYINNCRICDKDIKNKEKLSYISPITEVKLTVCKLCAIREYYGSGGKNTKMYKQHIKNNKLFGYNDN